MTGENYTSDARDAIMAALYARKKPVFLNNRDTYGRTLSEGEAAFHALLLISQTSDLEKSSDEGSVEIPRWVFNALVSAWKIFLLIGQSKNDRRTFGQVMGCEPIGQGGREGAKLSHDTWNELRILSLARSIEKECERCNLAISQEELADAVANQLAESGGDLTASDSTVSRYLKKYRKHTK